MTTSEEFFLREIERGLKILNQPELSTEERRYLTTKANEPAAILALLESVGRERSIEITQRCVKALEASYAKDQEPSSIEFNKKYNVENPMFLWKSCNEDIYQHCECGAMSSVVQEWYLSVGRKQEKKAAAASMGCLVVLILLPALFFFR